MNTLRLRIVSPDRVVLETEAQSVRIQGIDGSFGVLANHAPLMTATMPGPLQYVDVQGQRHELLVTDGFVEVRDNVVTIAAEEGAYAHEIDVAEARAAEKAARDLLANRAALAAEDVVKAEDQLRRALVRQVVGQRTGSSIDR